MVELGGHLTEDVDAFRFQRAEMVQSPRGRRDYVG
jgi:hypothetical protein